MVSPRDPEYLDGLVRELCALPHETEWVEFKLNFSENREIGEYISALSNGAALYGRTAAYMVWGIEDKTHIVRGTNFAAATAKQGNEPLENWLMRMLNPHTDFRFHISVVNEQRIVILEIAPASHRPIAFDGDAYIRVGNVKKRLREHPEKEEALWRIFVRGNFEEGIAAERVRDEEVLRRLNYPAYFELMDLPIPEGSAAILDTLRNDHLIVPCDAGGWNVTNMGVILLAKNLNDFNGIRRLGRKALRVIQHDGPGRIATMREQEFTEGYAVGFERIIEFIMALLPAEEVIEQALRRSTTMYPEIAVRELVANALIHQDLHITGSGPMVEIFEDRIEITSPGGPLIDPGRFLDSMSNSRNEALAALMRRFHICEERGSGIDKVVSEIEALQLPAPLFEGRGGFTIATMFAPKPLSEMDKPERIRACYLHACLRRVLNQPVNNASVRERFGLPDDKGYTASRLLREAVDSGLIIIRDPLVGRGNRRYLPFWAETPESNG